MALGMFDGVHLGHKAIIQKSIDYAKANNLKSAVITLAQHPRALTEAKSPPLITGLEERLALFEQLGLDLVLLLDFTEELLGTSAEDYLRKYLQNGLHAKFISVGYDHHFGKGRGGNVDMLKVWAKANNCVLSVLEPYKLGGELLSSSKIREYINAGEIDKANRMLGHGFFLRSEVVHGDKQGRRLGFPTANLKIEPGIVLPRPGVYYGEAKLEEDSYAEEYQAVINIGYRPSLHQSGGLSLEAHLLDFDRQIYGLKMELSFISRLRDERNFSSEEELIKQIKLDISNVLNKSLT